MEPEPVSQADALSSPEPPPARLRGRGVTRSSGGKHSEQMEHAGGKKRYLGNHPVVYGMLRDLVDMVIESSEDTVSATDDASAALTEQHPAYAPAGQWSSGGTGFAAT